MTVPIERPQVSVIVPTRDSAATIRACLQSVLAQTIPVEAIVVDNDSSDGTPSIARKLGVRVVSAGPERSTQRNIGAAEATGEWLLFVDSDMILDRDVVASCLAARAAHRAEAVVVPELAAGEGFLAACRALEKRCYLGDDDIEAARFFTRATFLQVHGYDEAIQAGGEDWDLPLRIRRAGGTIARADKHIVHLEGRISLRETFCTKRYYGRGLYLYRGKHGKTVGRQTSPLRPALLRNWKLLASRPHLAAGLVMLKSVELAGIIAGMLAARGDATGARARAREV